MTSSPSLHTPSATPATLSSTLSSTKPPPSHSEAFPFPYIYTYPPFWSLQPTLATRLSQNKHWSALIQSYCRHRRLFRLSLIDALQTPLFHNSTLRKRMSLSEAQDILDWMASEQGGKRAEWIGGAGGKKASVGEKASAWVYWRRPEEWAEVIAAWVEATGQKGTVLTLYELVEGEQVVSQEWVGMDAELLHKALAVLVQRGKAQVFGEVDQQGVKFF